MFDKIKKSNTEGFTIIEVMIVLAVAALILLIVLLAVPALQRNSRNTTIKNDASALTGGINTFESDNNGLTPTVAAGTGSTVLSGGGNNETTTLNGSTVVAVGASSLTTFNVGSAVTLSATVATSTLYVDKGYTCPATGSKPESTGTASTRSVAIYYLVEVNGGATLECASS